MDENKINKAVDTYESVCIKGNCKAVDTESKDVIRKALVLIKQQKTEIDRLNDELQAMRDAQVSCTIENNRLAAEEYLYSLTFKTAFDQEIEKVKSDVIKEFVTKLKEHVIVHDASDGYGKACYIDVISTIEIDNVATEMLRKDV